METKVKGKKITRSYVRGLLEGLKKLGVECVIGNGSETWFGNIEVERDGRILSDEEVMDEAVDLLIAEAPKKTRDKVRLTAVTV